jgi:hypothetical protein
LVITLLYLANMKAVTLPGCGGTGAGLSHLPARCIGLGRGYPVHFLTADQNNPEIDSSAFIKDWTQWSVVSFSAIYLLWHQLTAAPPPDGHKSDEPWPVRWWRRTSQESSGRPGLGTD